MSDFRNIKEWQVLSRSPDGSVVPHWFDLEEQAEDRAHALCEQGIDCVIFTGVAKYVPNIDVMVTDWGGEV